MDQAEIKAEVDAVKNSSDPENSNAEGKASDSEGEDIVDELQPTSRIETEDVTKHGIQEKVVGDFNIEATITEDDVQRAGGFGATDDIGSFLPVALDSTDFEASLRSARDYEEPQGEVSRPGLGWSENKTD